MAIIKKRLTTTANNKTKTVQITRTRGPRKNPFFSDKDRKRYFDKRVVEQRADEKRISTETGAEKLRDRLYSYLSRKTKADHITLILMARVFGPRDTIPSDDAMKHRARLIKDNLSGIMGKVQTTSKAISIARELDVDDTTNDIEWVFYNANLPQDLEARLVKDELYIDAMVERNDIRKTNAKKDKKTRKKLMHNEEANRAIF